MALAWPSERTAVPSATPQPTIPPLVTDTLQNRPTGARALARVTDDRVAEDDHRHAAGGAEWSPGCSRSGEAVVGGPPGAPAGGRISAAAASVERGTLDHGHGHGGGQGEGEYAGQRPCHRRGTDAAAPARCEDRPLDQDPAERRGDRDRAEAGAEQGQPAQAGTTVVEDEEQRPVPQVDAVGHPAEEPQRRQRQQAGQHAPGSAHDVDDQHGRRQPGRGQAAVEQPVRRSGQVGPQPHRHPRPRQAEQGDDGRERRPGGVTFPTSAAATAAPSRNPAARVSVP